MNQCYNKHFNQSFIYDLWTCSKFIITMTLLLTLISSYFCRKPLSSGGWENSKGLAPFTALFLCCCSGSWRVNIYCVTNFLCFFALETEFYLAYLFRVLSPHKALSWPISEAFSISSILSLWSCFLVIATITSIMPIDSGTLYARIGAFQSTKIDNLNFTVQHISFMHNKMSIKFFIILFFLMWVLLKIYFDIS